MKALHVIIVGAFLAALEVFTSHVRASHVQAESRPQATVVTSSDQGLLTLQMALLLPFPAEDVWALISDFGNAEVGADIADRVIYSGDSLGGERSIALKPELGGGVVSEQIFDVDQATRSFRYSVTDFGATPFAYYQGYMKISAKGPDHCAIYYRAQMFPTGVSNDAALEFAAGNMYALQNRLSLIRSD